jgi:hypothetical protein
MNLGIISQALAGGVAVTDPLRDREYKRARKQISDGIHGSAIGAALLFAAGLGYFLVRNNMAVYIVTLVLALAGLVKLFRSVGGIIDAKVGPKLLEPALQPRSSGGLSPSAPAQAGQPGARSSQRLPASPMKPSVPAADTRPVALPGSSPTPPASPSPPLANPSRPLTGRVNREHSSPLSKLDRDDDLMAKLRN